MLDGQTIMLILIVVLVLFGGSKLPELARSLGKATGEFKKAQLETEDEVRKIQSDKLSQTTKTTPIISDNIKKLASDLGISTEGKDEKTILDEIKALKIK